MKTVPQTNPLNTLLFGGIAINEGSKPSCKGILNEPFSKKQGKVRSGGTVLWLKDILKDAEERTAARPEWAKSEYAQTEIQRLRAEECPDGKE